MDDRPHLDTDDPREARLRDALDWAICASRGVAELMDGAPALRWDGRLRRLWAVREPRRWGVREHLGQLIAEAQNDAGWRTESVILPRDLRLTPENA